MEFRRELLFAVLLTLSCQVSGSVNSAGTSANVPADMLVFSWDRNLGTMDSGGRALKKLLEPGPGKYLRAPTWSPDGKRLAYYQWGVNSDGAFSLPEADLFVANADGSGGHMLLQHDKPGAAIQDPAWSSDGQVLYFTSIRLVNPERPFEGVSMEIQEMPLSGGAPRTVIKDAASPHLSRDGNWMIYLSSSPGTPMKSLVVAGPNGSNPRQLTKAGEFPQIFAPKLDSAGHRIVFAASTPRRDVPRTVTSPFARNPLLDPLGIRVAEADGMPMDLWTIGVDGTGLRQLTNLAEDSPYAAWSSDGQRIAFMGIGGVYMMNADGSDLHKISVAVRHGQIDWLSR